MPRKAKAPPSPPSPPTTPVPPPIVPPTAFVTGDYLQQLGLSPATMDQVVADAATVQALINQNQPLSRDTLTVTVVGMWGDGAVDRLNAALGLLGKMGLVYQMG